MNETQGATQAKAIEGRGRSVGDHDPVPSLFVVTVPCGALPKNLAKVGC